MRRNFAIVLAVLCVVAVCGVAMGEETTESLMDRARNLYGVGDYQSALILFQKTVEKEANNGEAWDYAGWCHRYLSNWASSEKNFQTALTHLSGASGKWVYVGLGETYLGAPEYEKAIGSFTQALGLAPDDMELVVRSMKGIILAYASLGDEEKVNEAIAGLRQKDPAAADLIGKDAQLLLEQAKKAKAEKSEPKKDEPLSNGETRRQEVVEEKKDASHAEKGIEIWGFTLGENMAAALSRLDSQKIRYMKNDSPTEFGSWLYFVDLSAPSILPGFLLQDKKAALFVLTEYDGKILAVNAMVLWNERNPIVKKSNMFLAMRSALEKKYGKPEEVTDKGVHSEAYWIPSDRHAVEVFVNASTNGDVFLQLRYTDLPTNKKFFDDIKAQGKNL